MKLLDEWSISFANPWLLLLLLAIPVLAFLCGKCGGAPAVIFSSLSPFHALGREVESKAGSFLTGIFFLSLAFFVVGLARPQAGKTITHVEASGIDIMIALDVSRSMLAEDFSIGAQRANRLEAIKKVTEEFIESRPNDRIGLTAFAGRPYLVSPLTLDHDWLLQNLERIRIGLVEDGTAIGSAIASAANRLKEREAKSKVIILLTDGENNAGRIEPETAAEAAATLGIKIYTIGAGTRGLAPYPFLDPFGRTIYQNVRVEFNEEVLKKVAQITNGQYYRATDTRSLEQIYAQIDRLEKTTEEQKQFHQYRDLFPWCLGAGFVLLTMQLVLSRTIWRNLP
jgi:Ca-activated chloride channel family protein